MTQQVLPDSWKAVEPAALERRFYGEECRRVEPESVDELCEAVRFAEARAVPCLPAGRGAHAYLGTPPPAPPLILSTARLDQVVRYEPGDFTISVQSGMRLEELRRLLRDNRQEVPVDVPGAAEGTVGGLVAAAVPGLRRIAQGDVSSWVIGLHGVRGGGRCYKTGGLVVKNVAGYEASKFLCGSYGTAGPLLQVNLKLRPIPEVRHAEFAVFASRRNAWDFAREVRRRALEPAALLLLDPQAAQRLLADPDLDARDLVGDSLAPQRFYAVVWLLEGNRALVDWLRDELAASLAERSPRVCGQFADAERFIAAFAAALGPSDPFADDEAVVQASVLVSDLERVEAELLEIFDGLPSLLPEVIADLSGVLTVRWRGAGLDQPLAAIIRALSAVSGVGWLTYLPPALRGGRSFLLRDGENRGLSRRVLKAFDPLGVFCPARMLSS